jgi:hypothetical protein
MKLKNTAPHAISINRDLYAGWQALGIRDQLVEIPAGAIFECPDGYAVRRRSFAGSQPTPMPSAADQLGCGYLKPHGKEAEELYATFYSDTLPATVLEMVRSSTASTSTTPDDLKRALEQQEFGKRMMVVAGEQQAEAAPRGAPVFAFED